MAVQTDMGAMGCCLSSRDRVVMATLIMPTWGPLPWATTT